MNSVKKLLSLLMLTVLLSSCVKGNDIPDYNLNLISPSLSYVYDYYHEFESETEKYVKCESSDFHEYIDATTIADIHSVTICDDKITENDLVEIISVCKDANIPIFFVMNNIDNDYLSAYDKAYCISADYNYIGEAFAQHINSIWRDTLYDRDNNQILSYSVITPEIISDNQSQFYSSLVNTMKLLGIPLDLKEEIYLSSGDVIGYCDDNKKVNECYIILDNSYLSLFSEYEFYSDGVEIIGMDFSTQNSFQNMTNMLICNIDCKDYFTVRDEILTNLNSLTYPFTNLEYSIVDKTVFIEPEF